MSSNGPLRRGALVGISDLVTLASLGVVRFELCTSQKCCITTWITLMYLECPTPSITGLSGSGQ